MITINGKYTSANIMIDSVEESCMSQIVSFTNHPAFTNPIVIQPDCHAGRGAVVGTVTKMTDKIVPAVIGVDVGCIDKDTEFLSPKGWIKISDWKNEKVLQYNKSNDTASFENPLAFIKKSCLIFYHFKTRHGMDQMLSPDHKMLVWEGFKGKEYNVKDSIVEDFIKHHESITKGVQGGIKTVFKYRAEKELPLSDAEIRVEVMIAADGHIRKRKHTIDKVELHFRKKRKIERAIFLLSEAGIKYTYSNLKDGSSLFTLDSPDSPKDLKKFWAASERQLLILAEECLLWDGHIGKHEYFSSCNKDYADIVQFAFTVSGIRANIFSPKNKRKNWKASYVTYKTKNQIVGFTKNCISKKKSIDGMCYCFTVPSGYFVIRRNGFISITGNCGVNLINIGSVINLPLPDLDIRIRSKVPFGNQAHEDSIIHMQNEFPWKETKKNLENFSIIYRNEFNEVIDNSSYTMDWFLDKCRHIGCDPRRAINSLGSVGGGNHAIEIGKDSKDNFWLMIHSGSRNFGKCVCDYWQGIASKRLRKDLSEQKKLDIEEIKKTYQGDARFHKIQELKTKYNSNNNTDSDWLEGSDAAGYIRDMIFAQSYAAFNRKLIATIILSILKTTEHESIESVHNYIDFKDLMIRKGAIRSYKNEKLCIPLNMKDGVLLCSGKSNEDWLCSAPHGAGRIMSRSQAKKLIDLKTYKEQMHGIYSSSVDLHTLDEAPDAYKDSILIENCIKDTVDILERIRPVFNMKDKTGISI